MPTGWRAWAVDRRTGSLGRAFLYANQQEWDTDWNEGMVQAGTAPCALAGVLLRSPPDDRRERCVGIR